MVALSWFLTIFLSALPLDAAVRIVDLFFYEGAKVRREEGREGGEEVGGGGYSYLNPFLQLMFQVALEMLRENEESIVEASDDGHVLVTLSQYTKHITERGQKNTVGRERELLIDDDDDALQRSVVDVLNNSYEHFGNAFDKEKVDMLRLRHRVKVVQNFEDSQVKMKKKRRMFYCLDIFIDEEYYEISWARL